MTQDRMEFDNDAVPDEVLMQRTAQGDHDAFVLLVRRHQSALVNFFRRMGDYNDAEDRAQETFVRLFAYRNRYRPTAGFKTFLYVLARRARIDHLRRKERRRKVHEEWVERTETETGEDAPSLDDARERVRAALDGLTEEMRSVVVMSVYQGLKYHEIADILGIPLGTVKTRMFHALRKLKEGITNGRNA